MTARRLCLTATDRSGATPDEEAWLVVDWYSGADAYRDAAGAFLAYLAGRGVTPGGLHTETDDWIRDYPKKYAT